MYYLVQIQTFEEAETVKALFEYATLQEALSACFSVMASSMANENIVTVLCQVIDKKGMTQKYEYYEKPVVVNPEA